MCDWIKVADKLPKTTDDVFVLCDSLTPFIGFYNSNKWLVLRNDYVEKNNVTHWAEITLPVEGE